LVLQIEHAVSVLPFPSHFRAMYVPAGQNS